MRQTIKEIEINCASCPFISQCTESKNNQKLIQRHIGEFYVEEAEHLRHTREIKKYMLNEKKQLNASLQMQGKEWYAMDNPKGAKKFVYADDAYFCCHEFREISYLDMASCLVGIQKAYLPFL